MVVGKQRWYRCIKCKETFLSHGTPNEIEEERCPVCFHISWKHKGCGGEVYDYDPIECSKIY